MHPKTVGRLFAFVVLPLMSGCNMVVMSPSGDIARQQADLILVSTALMLIIIVPVIFLTLFFAWKYRQSNTEAHYDPEWSHSTRLEVVIWSAPLAIIIALGAITWMSTHKLDPYRPLDRIGADRPIAANVKPLTVEVVALDWKWLFIYPEYGIASLNEMAAPLDVPINFKITASSVMNSFYIPALAGQIYAMPGMETRLHAVINKPGDYEGLSTNFSGRGFSHMRFTFKGLDKTGFDAWVASVRQKGTSLTRTAYQELEQPSEKEPVRYYSAVDGGLYDAILNMCVDPSKMCMKEMAMIDAGGGGGKESANTVLRLTYDRERKWGAINGQSRPFLLSQCTPEGAGPGGSVVLPPQSRSSFPFLGKAKNDDLSQVSSGTILR
ncbi:ubiquinol oxidase subunit II [Phyllobacterium salinisoli]|uniref:Ubiquinol oxidase polypeptide II n=2 Tax=Phyllobacterium salinisoli TaxID=1899321 RepID=A0A368K4Y4_9HYPH|nr:ubiquinol oxidase subunit II [Phyllobacterium salinisoli]RCS23060.1 ubiquinol oxidase subunit II [Phyllobacterium salinisoli]